MAPEIKSQVVKNVDIQRFMGDWFVIASIPTPFEKGAHNGLERYEWNEEEGRVDISFFYREDGFEGDKEVITQKGWIEDGISKAHWLVSPLWPFKFDYLVIGLAPDYSWTIVGVPDKSYLWIMARNHKMKPSQYAMALKRVKDLGYKTHKIIKVPQNGAKP